MRWLKYIIPEDIKDSLNANPGFQWLVIVILFLVGILLMLNGINGIKTKRITGKNGRIFEGTAAQILGAVYILFGLVLPVLALSTQL